MTEITDDKWHHIAGTYDKKSLKIYVDGVLEGEMAVIDNPDTTTGVLRFGVRVGGGNPLKGVLDEVALYSVALEKEKIQEIMNNGFVSVVESIEPLDKLTVTWSNIKVNGNFVRCKF